MQLRPWFLVILALVLAVGWAASCVIWRAAEVGELVGPLETRDFDGLTLIALGTGSDYENPERLGPAVAVASGETIVLVDPGRGVAESLRAVKIPVAQPALVLLTSLRPPNTLGLDDLLFTGWLDGRETPLRVVGPPGTKAFVDALEQAHSQGRDAQGQALALPAAGGRIAVSEADEGWSEQRGELRISAGALPGGPLPALAYRFEERGKSIVVGGTGWAPEALVRFASAADMLVHEGVYVPPPEELEDAGVIADPERLRREAELHTSLLDVGELAQRANVGTLVLVRMRPPPFFELQVSSLVGRSFDGEVRAPSDGEELRP